MKPIQTNTIRKHYYEYKAIDAKRIIQSFKSTAATEVPRKKQKKLSSDVFGLKVGPIFHGVLWLQPGQKLV